MGLTMKINSVILSLIREVYVMSLLKFENNKLYLDNEEFYLVSGDIHYFRIYPGGLERRLKLMKDFGLTTVQTYVPWNLHEPEKGQFNFEGLCDLKGFLELCDKMGLKVLLRPSPYICAEWDFGGLPHWLMHEKLSIRTSDEKYIKHVSDYYKRLCKEFVPYLSTNGGPIIAVAVENEYGSYGNDKKYLEMIADLLTENGVDVPMLTSDYYLPQQLIPGAIDGKWIGINYRIESKEALDSRKNFREDTPNIITEYWSGRAIHWGEIYEDRNVPDVAKGFREALDNGGLVNFYMFAGGTNFGFMNGANYGISFSAPEGTPHKYIPHTTTYDEDALINEQGEPTEKYFACRKELWDFLGKPEPPMEAYADKAEKIGNIELIESVSLLESLKSAEGIKSHTPLTFDELKQDFGYVLYRTKFTGTGKTANLFAYKLNDRADVFVDGNFIGTLDRNCPDKSLSFETEFKKDVTIEVLTENMGRINFGVRMGEKKGIEGIIHIDGLNLLGWENISLKMNDFSNLEFKPFENIEGPVFYKGEFKANGKKDVILDMRGFNKGFAVVNGFNLGRYWNKGPQYSLYVPRELLKENNEIIIFDHYGNIKNNYVETTDEMLLY